MGTVCVHALLNLIIFIHFIYCTDIYVHTHTCTCTCACIALREREYSHDKSQLTRGGATHNDNAQTAPRPPRADTVADFQHQPPAIFALIAPLSPPACFPLNVTLLRFPLAAGNVDGFHSRGTLRCSSSRRSHGEECGLWGSLDISNGW